MARIRARLLALALAVVLCLASTVSNARRGAWSSNSPAAPAVPAATPPDSDEPVLEPLRSLAAPEFVGSYRSDGRFQPPGRLDAPAGPAAAALPRQQLERRSEVPPSIDLSQPRDNEIEDLSAVHARSVRRIGRKSGVSSFLESIVVFAYGRQPVLRAPTHVTTDSRQRVIVSDPLIAAVHVLDRDHSFRIAGGPGRTLRDPAGVAVDAADNIYVADRKRGLVLVFDPQGRFLRPIGQFRGESVFEEPTAMALDRASGQLFVLDSPSNELLVFDLQGNVVRRAGGQHKRNGVSFDLPTEIAVRGQRVVILDSVGTRVQVLDLECHLLRAFSVNWVSGRPATPELGLALDGAANIYIGQPSWPSLRIYDPGGRLLTSFGQRNKDYTGPAGLWIDASDRIFIADPVSSRIQVFQHRVAPSARPLGVAQPSSPDSQASPGASPLSPLTSQ